jgi:amino acid adenylation domain-containing protein
VRVADLIFHLRNLDIRLSVEGDRLRVNAPKGVLTNSLRAQIAERKQDLLDFLRDNSAPTALDPPPVVRRMDVNPTPLSFAQERLWFLEQLEPASAVYNICRAWRLLGELNLSAIESSLNEIVRRHEVLRSSVHIADGRPVQVVQPPFELNLSVIDLQPSLPIGREPEIRERIQQAADAPFDFAAGKLLRAEVLRIADEEHVLILTTHHIVSDAWSMGILTRELWLLYEVYGADKSSQLEELQIQYADFAEWQREWLQGDVLEGQVCYWKEQLKDLMHLNLPTDRPRPARQSFEAARIPIRLPETLTAAIHELSNQAGVTPFMILLAAFQVLLYRYSGQEEIVVGSPIANRARTELEFLIGFFVNTLVLRSDLSGNPTFKEHLERVREVCLGAYAHQDLPFEKLVQELQPERDPSRNPLFQVMFALQNATRPFSGIPGFRIEPLEIQSGRSPFDLSVFLREREGKYMGFIEYNTDLFNGDRIEQMARHFQTLLDGAIANPDQPISTLPILTDSERHRILIEWNDTAADYPKDSCIHELFEAQVERTPEAIAVQFEGKQLTYRELNKRANQLAHYLRGLGIGPEMLVGICVERSLEMVVGLLGILKSGGAYVPVDFTYPKERLEFMLEDAQVSVLITQEKLIEDGRWRPVLSETEGMDDSSPRFPGLRPPMKIVCLDTDWDTIARESEQNPRSEVKPHNLAYVIYTSGSTGTPKAVAIEHRNTVNLLQWAKTVYGPTELVGVLASTSICFDLSVFEIFLPLCCGGRVILVENALCLDRVLERNDLTLINTVPSVMVELLRAGALPKSVRTVNLAGEPLRAELVKQIYDLGYVEKVYDLYGPSETTTYSTFTLRTPNGLNTIGCPISNTRIYVLDSHFQVVPIGVYGEIYIGGDGVARCYLNQPELTSERFVPHPFRHDLSSRLYRTGDRARYRPDGNIEFLGRTDNQVKIHGYRIELGEIEAVLNQHPTIKESIVVVRDGDSSGEKHLIAYLVRKELSSGAISELRNFLKDKLPNYMVPSLFVQLDALPLSPNGKTDRVVLQLRDDARPESKETYAEPRTHVQELLAQIWEEVLRIEAVGIHDNFFELGGHSLLAIQIISRVREAFDKDVPLSALFDEPTIAGLAATIEKTISGRTDELPPITRAPRDGPLPLSMNQEHLWRLDRMIPGIHFFNMPYVYHLSGDLNISALERALTEIIRRHEALRTVFAEINGRPTQVIKAVAELELPNVDLRAESADESSQKAASCILEERQGPFDLAVGPLVRIKLLRLTNTESLLLVTMHHIISDYWSMKLFRRELVALYEAFAQGRPSSLQEPTTQFADFAIWERRLLQMSLLDDQLSYWKKQLVAPLPNSYGPSNHTKTLMSQMSNEIVEFDQTLYVAIRRLAEREHCTLFTVLIAALGVALCAATGNQDVLIATLAANRSKTESEGVIGHMVNTLILRFQVSPANTIRQLLRQVRGQLLELFTKQEFPFEELARVLESDGLARQSLSQTLFSYQYRYAEVTKCSGLRFAPFNIYSSKTDKNIAPSAFSLILQVTASSTQFTGAVNYRTESLSDARARGIIQGFIKTLRLIVNSPNENLSAALMQM